MTLTEYKRQAQEIAEILIRFSGKEEEAEEFAKTLMEKYREFGEFNAKALECKNLAEFKSLADENGIKFESDEVANEIFLGLSKGKKEVEKAILNAEEMSAVSGGMGSNKEEDPLGQIGQNQEQRGSGQRGVPGRTSKLGDTLMVLGIVGCATAVLDGLLREGSGDTLGLACAFLSGFVGFRGGLINEYNKRTP